MGWWWCFGESDIIVETTMVILLHGKTHAQLTILGEWLREQRGTLI
jgi:hypothetical protein